MHNAMKKAAMQLPDFSYEAVIVNLYSYFHDFTKRTEALKKICDEMEAEFEKLQKHTGKLKNQWASKRSGFLFALFAGFNISDGVMVQNVASISHSKREEIRLSRGLTSPDA